MKKVIILIAIALVIQSCASVFSETVIDPAKTFVLGEGKHVGYSAKVKNVGAVDIEIFKQELDGEKVSIGMLKVNQEETYEVKRNTAVFFQNSSPSKVVRIKIELYGTSNLSMGYKGN